MNPYNTLVLCICFMFATHRFVKYPQQWRHGLYHYLNWNALDMMLRRCAQHRSSWWYWISVVQRSNPTYCLVCDQYLTHWGRDIFANGLQTFSNIFSWMKIMNFDTDSLKIVSKGRIDNIPFLVEKMAWRPPGDKPLSALMMVTLQTHTCVTRPPWVKKIILP